MTFWLGDLNYRLNDLEVSEVKEQLEEGSRRGETVSQTDYRSHEKLTVSDHKPVSAVFNVGVKVIDKARRQRIKEEIMKKLDMLENDFLPQVMVDQTDIIFDEVRFMESFFRTLAIANTGQVACSKCTHRLPMPKHTQ